jgi:Helix-turn-helix of DDE superfamily endonuclease
MVRAASLTDAGTHALTGLRPAQLDILTRLLTPPPPPPRRRGRPHALPLRDRILLAVMAWRTNLTHRALAALFQVGVATVHRVITQLTRRVAGLLAPITNRRDLWVIDGTLIPVHDHTVTAKSKNYRRSVCVQVVIRARDRRVVALGAAWPGNRNDIVVHRATTAATTLAHSRVIGDGAYRAAPDITTPPPRRNDKRPLRVRRLFLAGSSGATGRAVSAPVVDLSFEYALGASICVAVNLGATKAGCAPDSLSAHLDPSR